VSPDASDEEIRAAYRRRAKSAHPDRQGGSNEDMSAVNRAAEVLLDRRRRLTYDKTGEDRPSDIEVKAREKLVAGILNWMASPEGNQPFHLDMMAAVTASLLAEQRQIESVLANGQALVKKLHRHVKKLKYRGKGKPIIIQMIEYQIRMVSDQTGKSDDNLEIVKTAILLAKDFDYINDSAAEQAGHQIFMIGGIFP
jgi:curved DNA-binding protein CbpA